MTEKIIVTHNEVEKMADAMVVLNDMMKLYHNVANELNKENLGFDSWFTRIIKENAENQKTILEFWKMCQELSGDYKKPH